MRSRTFIRLILLLLLSFTLSTAAFAAPKKKSVSAKETITYVVKKGDTVDKIARKYEVRVQDIARWNNLSDVARIKIGQKLRIRVPKGSVVSSGSGDAPTITQNVSYVVKKGDNLGKIARKTGVSIEELKKNNPALRKNPDKLRVGQTLVLRVQRYHAVAGGVSRGLANNGTLSGGIQLKSGVGYNVRNPKRSYGTAQTINLIRETMASYASHYPKGPKFSIGDLSVERGGRLSPHLSHQSGRDVDISYVRTEKVSNGTTLDIEKNWYVLEKFLKTRKVQYIFIDYDLQKYFYDYAKKLGYSDKELSSMIQYPNGKKSYRAIIRHSKGHSNHFHVRFVCADTDVKCH